MARKRIKSGDPNHQGDLAHELFEKGNLNARELADLLGDKTEQHLFKRLKKQYLTGKEIEVFVKAYGVSPDYFYPELRKKNYKILESMGSVGESEASYFVRNIKDCVDDLMNCLKREIEGVKRENELQAKIIAIYEERGGENNNNNHPLPIKDK